MCKFVGTSDRRAIAAPTGQGILAQGKATVSIDTGAAALGSHTTPQISRPNGARECVGLSCPLYDVSTSQTLVCLVAWFLLFFAPMGAKNNKKTALSFCPHAGKMTKNGVRDRLPFG